MTIDLTPEEARGMIYHLDARRQKGMNQETVRGLDKLKKAVKESETMPLFDEETDE